MENVKYRYFKNGPKSTLFNDPKSGLVVVNLVPSKIEATKTSNSTYLNDGLANNHIVEIEEKEYLELLAKTQKPKKSGSEEEKALINELVGEDEYEIRDKEEDEEEEDEEEEDQDDEEDEEETIEDVTRTELMDRIRAMNVPEEETKNLTKLNKEDLWDIYQKYNKD